MNYNADVEEDAVYFIIDNDESIKEAIIEESEFYDAMDDLDQAFHESIVDRAYTLQDAAYVIENCRNRESDSGVWEGQDMEDAMQTCAAFSYGNDVREDIEGFYDELKIAFEDEYEAVQDARREEMQNDPIVIKHVKECDGLDLDTFIEEEIELNEDELKQKAIDIVFSNFVCEHTVHQQESGGRDEVYAIRRWLKLNGDAGMWGGYPVGSSYIDSRCGTGYSMPEIKNYVDLDRRIGIEFPELRNKNREQMKERLKELEDKLGTV